MLYYCLLVMTESPTNTAELKCHLWCGLAAAQVLDGGPDPLMGRGTSEGDILECAQTCQTVDKWVQHQTDRQFNQPRYSTGSNRPQYHAMHDQHETVYKLYTNKNQVKC